jgi:hypothetical protein
MAATIAIVIYACYHLGGKPIPVLLSAHIMWILWWGQIEGWGILGFLLAWIALKKRSWPVMFLALALAAFKPQVSLVPVLALWWWSGKQRWYSLAALLALFALSLWVWGPWPVWYVQGALRIAGQQRFGPWNASLGLIAAPLFIPALLLPLERDKRIIALTATALIASPYLPYYSSILLLCFPIPLWAYLFGFLAYLPSLIGTQLAWNGIVLLPISILVWIYWPILKSWPAWQNFIQIFQRTPRT